jgi:hypothetical protein
MLALSAPTPLQLARSLAGIGYAFDADLGPSLALSWRIRS